jgi:hypothetical protein
MVMARVASDRLPDPSPRRHREVLTIACLVIAAAFVLQVRPEGRVGPALLPGVVLPPLCLSRKWFGIACPGCGLTRSFIHLAHGDWQAAWQCHRLGWLVAGLVVLQIPYRVHGLCRPRRPLLAAAARKMTGYVLLALLVVNWMLGWLV